MKRKMKLFSVMSLLKKLWGSFKVKSSDLIEIVKHEINVDDQDCTSHHNEDIDDPSSPFVGFTVGEIAEAECRLESFKKIDAIFLANYKEDMSVYACGTPTGIFNSSPFLTAALPITSRG